MIPGQHKKGRAVDKVTAADVARAAGTSTAAVSRAFRTDAPISPALRARIRAAADHLGYSTPSARSVARLTTGTITLVAGDLDNPFYPMAANALSQALHASGRRMILHSVPPGGDVDQVLGQVLTLRSDAAIVTSALMSSHIARACRQAGMPVVLFNRIQPDTGLTAVTCDNYGGGRLVAQRFLAGGRRRIAVIGGRRDTSTHLERMRGFCDQLTEAGLAPVATATGDYDYTTSLGAVRDLIRGPGRPDAIFCINDVMALAALDAARQHGVTVPADLAIIGFDDIPMAGWDAYRLTTVRQPLARMVSATLELITRLQADPDAAGMIRIAPVKLIERNSG